MPTISNIHHVAAFTSITSNSQGGNPAGVLIDAVLPDAATMQRLATELGYSETVFAAPAEGEAGWRVRYFAPDGEVPFCGHATIALGAVLAQQQGDGVFALITNHARITVAGSIDGDGDGMVATAALQSPPTSSAPAPAALTQAALALFGYHENDLDMRIAPALANGGAGHLVLALASRERLRAMHYDLEAGRALMRAHGIATIALVHAQSAQRFHARNPFASGGVYEDPATGAAAAALAGYLRDIGWPHGGAIDIIQGEDMGVPCHLRVEIGDTPGSSVRVSGAVRWLAA